MTEFPAVPFTVKVLIDDLNYRSAASMSGEVKGQTGKGVFTIVEVKDGWGRLKSGAGWIWLKNPAYCTVQGTVTEQKTTAAKSVDEIAKEVIQGKWGNGDERKEKLAAAGYDYAAVQKRVIMDDKNQLAVEASEPVPQEVMEKYDQEMDKKTRDNMERFAEFMARMIEKYGRKVLAGIEDDEAPNDTQSGEKANAE